VEKISNLSYKSLGNDFPIKVLKNKEILEMIENKRISPFSFVLNPTNKCNLNCDFCSCKGDDRKTSLDLKKIKYFTNEFKTIKTVIIAGGGEPLCYKEFDDLIEFFYLKGILMGLVTNGLLLPSHDIELIDKISWIRISLSKDSLDTGIFDILHKMITKVKKVKFGLSFVCSDDFNKDIETISVFGQEFLEHINHFRIVNDLWVLDDRVAKIKKHFEFNELKNGHKLIFNEWTNHAKGKKKCYMPLLKPNITATGEISPCCCIQFAKNNLRNRCFNEDQFSLGKIENAKESLNIDFYDGSNCDVCYYGAYNDLIDKLSQNIEDVEFI